jgi:hypothetical protein
MAITLDSSTPAFVSGTANPATTASFTPPSGSLLIAFAEADESNTFSISGGGLTWTALDTVGVTARNSLASWWAIGAGASMTVSVTKTGSFTANAVKVLVFTGAEATFTGAHNVAQSNTITLTGTQTGSWMWAAVGDNLGATSDTAGTGCTYNDAEIAFGGVSGGILKRTTADGVAGSGTTLSAGSSSADMSIIAVEIKAPSTASSPALPYRPPPGLTPFGLPQPWQGTGFGGPVSIQASIADNAGASDTVTRIVIVLRSVSDTAAASDTVTRIVAEPRSVSDAAAATDAITRALSLARPVSDTAPATDAVTRSAPKARSVADTAPAADTATRSLSEARPVTDTAAATDAVTRALAQSRSISDSAPATDVAARGETQARSIADAAAATDAVTRADTDPRAIADTAPATDAVARSLSLTRSPADTAPASDTVSRSTTAARSVSDTAPASDTVSASTGGHLARDISDSAPASDAITRTGTHGRTVGDTAAASDGIVRMVVMSRTVADIAPGADSLGWSLTRLRLVSDTALAFDSVLRLSRPGRNVTDTAFAADAVASELVLVNPVVTPTVARSGWYSLLDTVNEIRDLRRAEQTTDPAACPDCGEPLRLGPAGQLFCPNDSSEWQAGPRRTFSPTSSTAYADSVLGRAEREQIPVACGDCGEPLRTGPNGELYCSFDGSIWTTGNRRAGQISTTHN